MRFMMMLPAAVDVLENWQPTKEVVGAMRKFSDDMRKAGVLLSAEGLHPTSMGTRIRVSGGRRTLTDGPFAEAKEVIAGFWMIQVKPKDEAVEWGNRCPLGGTASSRCARCLTEAHDFPPDLQPKSAKA
jgi:hypothetical protein